MRHNQLTACEARNREAAALQASGSTDFLLLPALFRLLRPFHSISLYTAASSRSRSSRTRSSRAAIIKVTIVIAAAAAAASPPPPVPPPVPAPASAPAPAPPPPPNDMHESEPCSFTTLVVRKRFAGASRHKTTNSMRGFPVVPPSPTCTYDPKSVDPQVQHSETPFLTAGCVQKMPKP